MKEYALVFRTTTDAMPEPLTAEQIQQMISGWQNWMGSIAAQNKLVNNGSRLGVADSRLVKGGGVVINGPYTEVKEFINGYVIIKAGTVDEAVEIAKECPIVKFCGRGSVEVRPLVTPDDNS
jgi:hypothetical protein